jgi:lipopolysaccharide biosynthesis glycosyltransferase
VPNRSGIRLSLAGESVAQQVCPATDPMVNAAVPVVLCFDGAYAKYAAVTVFSLLVHARTRLKIYCLVMEAADDDLLPIREVCSRFAADLKVVSVDARIFADWKLSPHLGAPSYLRLLIPDLIDEDKIIYLDCDLLATADIAELHAIDLEGNLVGGVLDPKGQDTSKVPRKKGDPYINSGVLLLDVSRMRGMDFFERCTAVHSEYLDSITWMDQCIINKVAEGSKKVLDSRWNRQVRSDEMNKKTWKREVLSTDSRVIHFFGPTKPWMEWCAPCLADYWWSCARLLDLKTLTVVKCTTVEQLIYLAERFEEDGEYAESIRIKNRIINLLLAEVRRKLGT